MSAQTYASQGTERTTAELLTAARKGDGLAWRQLVERHQNVVWSTVHSFRLQEADTCDAVQMTWLRLMENLSSVRDPERLHGWLGTTASRECLRLLRRNRAVPVDDDTLTQLTGQASGPEQGTVDAAAAHELWQAVDQLPPRMRLLLRLMFAEERTPYANVARETGLALGSLGPTRARALAKLRRRLEERGVVSPEW